jgi:uncharacterized protein (DUF4415 family)
MPVVRQHEPARALHAPAKPVEVAPKLTAASTGERGTTKLITLRLPLDVLEAWKASGRFWSTRMIELLREHKP